MADEVWAMLLGSGVKIICITIGWAMAQESKKKENDGN